MLSRLNVYNMPPSENSPPSFEGFFHLTTCQRTLLAGLEEIVYYPGSDITHIRGGEAYGYLLEIISGLQSQILAENEVVCQFKAAFRDYLSSSKRNTQMVHVLEKLFMDNKEIRSQYLKNVGQQSYTGICKKILQKKVSSKDVLILGSGNLASTFLKLLSKKYNLFLSARNQSRINELSEQYNFTTIPWPDLKTFKTMPNIVSTIGAYKTFFDRRFFYSWQRHHDNQGVFIDLGSPSIIQTNLSVTEGVYRLHNIFNESKNLGLEKELQIINAKNAIKNLVDKRIKYFDILPINHHQDNSLGL